MKYDSESTGSCARRSASLDAVAKPSMEVNISFRVSRELRDAARETADEREENVSDVLRAALERYVAAGGGVRTHRPTPRCRCGRVVESSTLQEVRGLLQAGRCEEHGEVAVTWSHPGETP
ncbi:hypothetical protein NOK12_16360 [Nocardioides sp. OK12]|nr:hypothetical protein NOK12_16360 [Nocardioides sp. OK12]